MTQALEDIQLQLNKQKQAIADTQSELFGERKSLLAYKEVEVNDC